MEILQFLLSFLLEEYGADGLKPIIDAFGKNSFDIKKTLKNIDPKDLIPILREFLGGIKNTPPENDFGRGYGTSPLTGFADKEIIRTLNEYFEELSFN